MLQTPPSLAGASDTSSNLEEEIKMKDSKLRIKINQIKT